MGRDKNKKGNRTEEEKEFGKNENFPLRARRRGHAFPDTPKEYTFTIHAETRTNSGTNEIESSCSSTIENTCIIRD